MNNSINQKTCMFETIKDLQKYLSVAQTEEKILFECPLFQIKGDNPSPAKASIKFFRFYESFMLISKVIFQLFPIIYFFSLNLLLISNMQLMGLKLLSISNII